MKLILSGVLLAATFFLAASVWAGPNPNLGAINLVAGAGPGGYVDGDFASARFLSPSSLCVDPWQAIWVCDPGNRAIRRIDLKKDNWVDSPFKSLTGTAKFFGAIGRWEAPLDLYPLDSAGDLIFLSKGGTEIDILHANEGRTVQIYKGKPLSQLQIYSGAKMLFALEKDSGKVLKSAFSSDTALDFQPILAGTTQTCISMVDQYLITYQAPKGLYGLADCLVSLTSSPSTIQMHPPEGYPTDFRAKMNAAHFDDNTVRYYYWSLGSSNLYRNDPVSNKIIPQELPNARGIDNNVKGSLTPFGALGGLWVNSPARALFISDSQNNRILMVKDYDWPYSGFGTATTSWEQDYSYPRAKPAHTKRIFYYGSSFSYETENAEIGKLVGLNKRLEYYLNLKALASGSQEGYEVIFDGRPLGWAGDGTDILSHILGRVGNRAAYGPDLYFIQLCPMDVLWCGLAYLYSPLGADGIPVGGVDPEYALSKDVGAKFKGLAAEIRQEVKDHQEKYAPDLVLDAQSKPVFNHLKADVYQFFGKNHFTELMCQATGKMLHVLSQKLTKASPGAKLVIGFYTNRNFVGFEEVRGGSGRLNKMSRVCEFPLEMLEDQVKGDAIQFLDIGEKLRIAAPSHYPLFIPGNDHLSQSGAELAGYLTSELLWPMLDPKKENP